MSSAMTNMALPPVEVLALNHVLENVLNIPSDSEVHSALKEFWIFSIHDLMNLHPHELLNMTYIHSTMDDTGVIVERTCRFPPMLTTRNIELLQQWFREAAGSYYINDMQSEPHHQHQNPAERRFQDVRKVSSQIMDRTCTPASYWLLSLLHTTYILS
jgi:hypothetical protein